ncbi:MULTISPECIES: DUF2179 domain-containing protein [Paenibacillus]|uniref:UPF0316 protein IJ22_13610 n=1 Tax=Paenibacillus naphthalenovorans TaxID=162209 RepID=A0A0U2U5Q1_9BACL|nr:MULTISPECIES: DUF2179 domain-containing protein [Paenibacillus]ALS21737.1 hypothetical protein IJ22_13610 [Paenibacillus naphthalenovorans]NTZ16482.1 DUF2179 domain-containing protein [Paenibacillus sp. JMULE4]
MNGLEIVSTIVVMNVVYVSLFTIRIILVMKARRLLAALISMAEVFIYLMALNIVLKNIDEPINLAAYCLGWGAGVWLGIKIEEWLALGYTTLQIVVDHEANLLPLQLREKGFGVTSWLAEGRDGPRLVMQVLAKRNQEKNLMKLIENIAPKAFVISYEPRTFRGGFWTKILKR